MGLPLPLLLACGLLRLRLRLQCHWESFQTSATRTLPPWERNAKSPPPPQGIVQGLRLLLRRLVAVDGFEHLWRARTLLLLGAGHVLGCLGELRVQEGVCVGMRVRDVSMCKDV